MHLFFALGHFQRADKSYNLVIPVFFFSKSQHISAATHKAHNALQWKLTETSAFSRTFSICVST